jgi:acetyl esterase/lipase
MTLKADEPSAHPSVGPVDGRNFILQQRPCKRAAATRRHARRAFLLHAWLVGPWIVFLATTLVAAQPAVEKNVVYGMYSGTALLMDVYRPANSNHRAVIAIMGSAWYAPQRYDAPPLKEMPEVVALSQKLTSKGYTVFAINHRASPRFRYPAAVEDAQRAVRFIRYHAKRFDVDPRRIGAWGISSGGHLAALLGTLDGSGDAADADPINQASAKVQAVTAVMPATDFPSLRTPLAQSMTEMFMGFAYLPPSMAPPGLVRDDDPEVKAFREASPTSHVTADDAPFLLIHGEADEIAPIQQSEVLEGKLESAGVTVRLLRVSGGQHGPNFLLKPGDPRLPDDVAEAVQWFDRHLAARE